ESYSISATGRSSVRASLTRFASYGTRVGGDPALGQGGRVRGDVGFVGRGRRPRVRGRIDRDDALASLVGDDAVGGVEQAQAVLELSTSGDQPAIQVQERVGVLPLRLDVPLRGIDRGKPGLTGREAAARGGVPLHRVAHRVPPARSYGGSEPGPFASPISSPW